jgi:hypothetical protein
MAEEFGGDLTGAEFWGADMRGARFRDVNLTDVKISHAWLVDFEVDAFVDRMVVNGVDVTAFVNAHDPWYPLRAVLRVTAPEDMRAGWARLGDAWATMLGRVRQLPEAAAHESVDGEWSFVETLRHLVFAMDKWFTAPLLGGAFHAVGLVDSGSAGVEWPNVDRDAAPSLADVLVVREEQAARMSAYLAAATTEDLDRTVDIVDAGPHRVRECIATVLEEEFWHHRYADRDLRRLETKG